MRYILLMLLMSFLISVNSSLAQCQAGESQVIIEIDGSAGQYNSEIFWRLYNDDTDALVTETTSGFLAPSAIERDTLCLQDGVNYRFEAYDTFGDGWNDAIYSILYSDGFVLQSGMPNNGGESSGNNDLEETYVFTGGDRPGDDCSMPKEISVGETINVRTKFYSNSYELDPLFDSGNEAIFSFTPLISEQYAITFSDIPSLDRGSLQLFDNCYDNTPTRIAFDSTGVDNNLLEIYENLTAGTTYFIVISNNAADTGVDSIEGNLNIAYSGTPINMSCENAYTLNVDGDSIFSRTMSVITSQEPVFSMQTQDGDINEAYGDSLFYDFTLATQEDILIKIGDIDLYTPVFIELEKKETCGEEAESTFRRAALEDIKKVFAFNNLLSGTYRLKIFLPSSYEDEFYVAVKTQGSQVAAQNQTCENALELSVYNSSDSIGSNSTTSIPYFNATNSGIGVPCSQDSIFIAGTGDVWVKAQVPQNGDLIVETFGEYYDVLASPDQALETRISVYTGACGSISEFYCSDKFEAHQKDTIGGLPQGEEVFIRLWDRNGDNSGLMNIRLFEPDPLPFPETSVTSFTDSLYVDFTNFTGDFEFFYDVKISEDSFQTFLPGFNPATISSYQGQFGVSGLQPATTYYFQIFSKSNKLTNSDTTVFQVQTEPYYINTIANGNWSDPNIWQGGVVPPADSAVNIYHRVSINQGESFDVNSVKIVGAFEEQPNVGLWINNGSLNISKNGRVEHLSGVPTDSVGIFMFTDAANYSVLDVGNNLVFELNDSFADEPIQFLAINNGDSLNINVANEFLFRHLASDTTLFQGDNIYFQSVDFSVGGNLFLFNDNYNSPQPLNAVFQDSRVVADIFEISASENTYESFQVNFTGSTEVDVNSNFRRQGNGGKIKFIDQSTLRFNGIDYQEITGFGDFQDSIIYNNIIVDIEKDIYNGRDNPILNLRTSNEETYTKVLIQGELNLIRGIITDENDYSGFGSKEIVFGENATAVGANPNSFVKGVASKKGNTPFTFPVGHEGGLKQIRILNNEEFQSSDLVRVFPYNNYCRLLDSLIVNSTLARDRTEEYWEITSSLSDSSVAATFEPIIHNPYNEGITDFTSLELVNFYNGSTLGNGSSTDSSFQTAIQYDFSVADTARFGLASNLESENPFYYRKEISSLSQYAAAPGENITINYSGAFASASDEVYFGGKLASTVSNTVNSLTVTVPEGARSGKIELIYENDKITYSRQNFSIKYNNPTTILSENYGNLSVIDSISGNVLLGQTNMQLGQIDNDASFDAMIVSRDYQAVTQVNNLNGVISKQEFDLFNEGTLINPTKFELGLSNMNGTIGLDAIFEFEVSGNNGLLYYQNDGFGNFSQFEEGEADGEIIYNDYLFNDFGFDGVSDVLFSVFKVSDAVSMLSASGNENTCSPYSSTLLPLLEPSNKIFSSILLGDFIDNGSPDIAYLIKEESMIGILDLYSQDTLYYYSNNSRTADQIYEIKNISLLNDGASQIVASNQSTNEIEVYSFNNGTSSIDITSVPLSFTPAKMDAEDINGDGYQDLIVSDQNSASLHILMNNGAGQLAEEATLSYTGGVIADFDVLDLNNDGVKDFLLLQEGGQLSAAYYEILDLNTPIISASNITTSSFDLAWDSVENAVEYEVFISLENDTIADLSTDSTLIIGDTALTFEAPAPFETYYVFGRTISSAGDTSNFSNSVAVNLLTLDSLNFQAQNITNNGFDLSWDAVANAGSYEILISLQESTNSGLASDSIFQLSDTSISFNAPVDFEEYFVYGRAISPQGDTAGFGNSYAVQLENIQVPIPVANNPNSNGFDLSWTAIAGADQYKVYIGTNADTTTLLENDSSFVVANETISYQAPEYSELYYFFVKAISNSGDTSAFSIQDSVKLPVSTYLLQDSLALVSLYETNGGDSWANNQNWLTGKLNTWEGLEMNADSLFAINLPSNQLDGSLTSDIGNLNFITAIDFSNNNLTDVSALISQANNLNSLNLSGNALNFEQLEVLNSIPNFNYNNQNFVYDIPTEIFESLGTDISIVVEANASENTFQWYKDSVQIAGETTSTINLANAQRADEGLYYVEVKNTLLPDLALASNITEIKISSLERDVVALRQFYDSTNGDGWSTIIWDTTSDNPTEWSNNDQDIIVENNRVVEINLPENNLTGSIPNALNEVRGLRTINLANNAIEDLADLTALPNLTQLDLSGNVLGFDDLERNISIDGFEFNSQANFGNEPDQKIPQGSDFTLSYEVEGSANVYGWYRNDELVNNADTSEITIDSITFETMGEYRLEVKNSIINAIDPDFTLNSNPVNVIASSTISGTVQDANEFATESGQVYLFSVSTNGSYDSVRLESGNFFQNIQENGSFELHNIELGEYLIYIDNNENDYPDLLNTYYQNTIDWELAEIVSLRSNIDDVLITMEGEPQALTGTSVLSGYLEEEYEEEERKLPRRRVSSTGVSVRRLAGSSRDISLRSILENNELVAYLETDENGEFEIPNLPAGRYTVKFDIPGVPMNEQSDITFDLTGEDQEALEIAAVSDNGQISVTRVSYTANKSELFKNVTVYPNPSDGRFKIAGTEAISNIKIISSDGRLIEEISNLDSSSNELELDISNYPDGMYFMQIVWKDGLQSMNKLIKE